MISGSWGVDEYYNIFIKWPIINWDLNKTIFNLYLYIWFSGWNNRKRCGTRNVNERVYIYTYYNHIHIHVPTCKQVECRKRICRRIWKRYDTARSNSTEMVRRQILHRRYHSITFSRRCGTIKIISTYLGTLLHSYIFKYKNGVSIL